MSSNEIFKTVMKGYKKEDVISYISNLSDQIERLKEDIDQKDIMIGRLQKDIEAFESEKTVQEQPDLDALRAEIKQQTESELRAEYDAKLQQELQKAKDSDQSEAERKAKEYEECKDALTDLMIQARHTADDIIVKAKADADALRIKSETEFAQLSAAYDLLKQNVAGVHADIERELDQISDSMDRFEKEIESIKYDIDQTIHTPVSETETVADDTVSFDE